MQNLNYRDLRALERLADRFTKKNYDLNLLKKDQEYPVVLRAIENHFKNLERRKILLLPELSCENQTVAIFSDYGGEAKDSKCYTYSFLVCAWQQTGVFRTRMLEIRQKHGLYNKEISFKNFRHGPTKRALDDYLAALNFVPGLLFTVVIDKGADSISASEISQIVETLKKQNLGKWKPSVVEKLLRVCHIAAYLVSLLIGHGQKVFWMTDHDAIAANEVLTRYWLTIFAGLCSSLSKHEIAVIGGSVPFKEKSLQMLDLLSSADVVAGSVEHHYTRLSKGFEQIKEEVNKVLVWLCDDGLLLKKQSIIIMKTDTMAVKAGSIGFELKQPDMTAIKIPVFRP